MNSEKELEALEKENNGLRQPLKLPRNESTEENIKEDQKEASEALDEKQQVENQEDKKKSGDKAQKRQKAAAQKMKQLSMQMQAQMGQSSQEALEEDIEMLRQILDNLLLFSFDEERIMDRFSNIDANHNEYATYLKKQKELRTHFEHVDDSLFAISLRQPKISEQVNKEISEVYFNIDKALDLLSENDLYRGVAAQQYTVTAANNLADFLSETLDNLQNAIPSPGSGSGEGGTPLPDIIMSQEELNKQMEEGVNNSDKGKPKEGEGQKPGSKPGDTPSDSDGQGQKTGGQQSGSEKGESGNCGKGEGEGKGANKLGGDGFNEDLNGELYRIYQQQQLIRQALEERLLEDKLGKGAIGETKQLLKDMEHVELDLINNGFTNETLSKMMQLQHQLLKLEKATFEQGEDTKRKSETNKKEFENTTSNQIPTAKEYFNTTEILNKQALPLQQIYKMKVQEYFKKFDD
ncbi:hypothetical protein [Lacinutrix neustonica]|uniref:hypothetical protein n=1 Tax=Lacinutrix neustonica TaxID=2980107 RepID=UPI0028BD9416|nr:hypothetical protein [Lacinutrix neustonica]